MSDREIYLRLRRRAVVAVALMLVCWVVMVSVASRLARADELSPDAGCDQMPSAPWCTGPSDDPLEHVTAIAAQSCEDGLMDVVYTVTLDEHARAPVGVTVRTPMGDTTRTVRPGESTTVTDDTRTSRWWGQIVVAGEVLVDADWGPSTCDPVPDPAGNGTDDQPEPGPVTDDEPAATGDVAGGSGPVEVRWPDPAPPTVDTPPTSPAPTGAASASDGAAPSTPAADRDPSDGDDDGDVMVTVARAIDPDSPSTGRLSAWALVLAAAAAAAVLGIDARWRALSTRTAGTLRTTRPHAPGGAERGPAVPPTRPRLAAGGGRSPHTDDGGEVGQ